MSTVAIVMTTYNGVKYVGEQIDSILTSSYQDFELFIYDDGSKDDTISILRSYEQNNPTKVHVIINENNLGVTVNFLQGASKTTMEYVMFCDQDDVWKPNKIAITLKRMRHMEVQLGISTPIAVFTDAIVVNQELEILKHSFFCSNHLNPWKTDLAHILMENKLIGCTVMINCSLRKLLKNYRLPTNAKFHDWWIALIAASMGKIGYVNEGTILYRQHSGNVVGGADFTAYFKNRIASLKLQKEALRALYRQAEEFLSVYDEILSENSKNTIRRFADLDKNSYIIKRKTLIHYGYLKTGMIRNIGLIIIV